MKLDPYLIPLTKNNLKWIKDLKVRPKTMNLFKNIGTKILDVSHNNFFGYDM